MIIKRAKEHPEWYTKEDVKFAKMVKRRIKQEKQAKRDASKTKREYSEKEYWEGKVPDDQFDEYLKDMGMLIPLWTIRRSLIDIEKCCDTLKTI